MSDFLSYILAANKLGKTDALPFLGLGKNASSALRLLSVNQISQTIAKANQEKDTEQILRQAAIKQSTALAAERDTALSKLEMQSGLAQKIAELMIIVQDDQVELSELQRLYKLLKEKLSDAKGTSKTQELEVFKQAYSLLARALSDAPVTDEEILARAMAQVNSDNSNGSSIREFEVLSALLKHDLSEPELEILESHVEAQTKVFQDIKKWQSSTLARYHKNFVKRIEGLAPICEEMDS